MWEGARVRPVCPLPTGVAQAKPETRSENLNPAKGLSPKHQTLVHLARLPAVLLRCALPSPLVLLAPSGHADAAELLCGGRRDAIASQSLPGTASTQSSALRSRRAPDKEGLGLGQGWYKV